MKYNTADAIVIGAGAGRFYFSGHLLMTGNALKSTLLIFSEKYGITDMYSGGFYPYNSLEEYWAWWARHIYINRYDVPIGKPYRDIIAACER